MMSDRASDKTSAMSNNNDKEVVGGRGEPQNRHDDTENIPFAALHNKQILPPAMGTGGRRSGSATSSGTGGPGRQHKLKQRFTVIRKLGKGTYGKVQLAINKETGQEVAIKTIKKTKIENEQDLERVRREIQIMSSIEHPHIIHIYEVFENKDKIVLIMQYAPGGELYEYVSQSKVLDEMEARRLFRQVATAIYYCHKNKICHRDLKLENILLDEKNNAKLADFGLSNVFDKSRQLKTFCGSPLYASPEIVQGSPYEGPEVDCWSLGVLLYTLVYGAMPFDGSNFKRLVKQISEACYYEPKQKSQASPLISRLLCADPDKRATILDICQDPWVNGHNLALSPPSPTRPLSPITGSSANQQQQTHTSLLKVAQDMANLTPVRLDILLALTPAPSSSSNHQNETNVDTTKQQQEPQQLVATSQKHTIEPAVNHEGARKRSDRGSGGESRGQQQRKGSRMIMDLLDQPSLMEVDETRATSPVASYVVRDLANEDEARAGQTQSQQPETRGDEPMEGVTSEPIGDDVKSLAQNELTIEPVSSACEVVEDKPMQEPVDVNMQSVGSEQRLEEQDGDAGAGANGANSDTIGEQQNIGQDCAEFVALTQEPVSEVEPSVQTVEEENASNNDQARKISDARDDVSVRQADVVISTEKQQLEQEDVPIDVDALVDEPDDCNSKSTVQSNQPEQIEPAPDATMEPVSEPVSALDAGSETITEAAKSEVAHPEEKSPIAAAPEPSVDSSTRPESTSKGDEPKTEETEVATNMDVKDEQAKGTTGAAEGESSKPKKVKKRIVVVKKKRKVAKREAGGEPDGEVDATKDSGAQKAQEPGADDSSASDKNQEKKAVAGSGQGDKTGPGKVQVPEPFKAAAPSTNGTTGSSTTNGSNNNQSRVPRRQSAMIAGVSQKLLQKQQEPSPSSREIELDQPQLASVRVSDKAEEFERRASLNATQGNNSNQQAAGSVSPRGSQGALATSQQMPDASLNPDDGSQNDKMQMRTQASEPQRVSCRRESSNLIESVGQSIVEPVSRLQYQLAEQLDTPIVTLSDPITPTGADMDCKVNSFAQFLDDRLAGSDENSSRLSPTMASAGDDRSDSVETIRAESSVEPTTTSDDHGQRPASGECDSGRPATVRSSLQISLGSNNSGPACDADQNRKQTGSAISSSDQVGRRPTSTGADSNSDRSAVASLGPAPITRSYKKVTFTKDGTCITETGKIYSTQADDGTMRRVERKSKVTHYASDSDPSSLGAATKREETHEEIVYEDGHRGHAPDQLWHSGPRQSFDFGQAGGRPMPPTRLQDSSSSFGAAHSAQQRPERPFERLIMPSSAGAAYYGDDVDDQDDVFLSQQQQQEQEEEQQYAGLPMDGMDSGSSCSSGSTDVFDDIFDTWTGAISMFSQRNNRLPGLRNSLMNRAFVTGSPLPFGGSASGRSNRPQSGDIGASASRQRSPFHVSSSLAGTPQAHHGPRCGSVEPPRSLFDNSEHFPPGAPRMSPSRPHRQHQHRHRPCGRRQQADRNHPSGRSSVEASGYESDVPYERPASARLGSARGMFGSSNLFPRHKPSGASGSLFDEALFGGGGIDDVDDDDFFGSFGGARLDPFAGGSLLMQEIEMEHEKLRRKMARQRKQLWKGSTPALNEMPVHRHAAGVDTSSDPMHQQPPVVQSLSHLRSTSSSSSSNAARPPQPVSPSNFQQQPQQSAHQQRRVVTSVYKSLQQQPQQQQQQAQSLASSSSSPMSQLNQSLSSGKLSTTIRQSVPLDCAPTRRNTANLAEHLPPRQPLGPTTMRRSTSKISIVTSQLAEMQLADGDSAPSASTKQTIETTRVVKSQKQHETVNDGERRSQVAAASFIQLKRSSSSSQSIQQQHQHQQRQQIILDKGQRQESYKKVQESVEGSQRDLYVQTNQSSQSVSQVPQSAGSSSAFWEDRMTPTSYSTPATESQGLRSAANPLAAQDNEANSRIQNWLQQSAGNLSISSGSKSSASDTLPSSGRSDVISQASQSMRRCYADEFTSGTTKSSTTRLVQQQQQHHRLEKAPTEAVSYEQMISINESQSHQQQQQNLPPAHPSGSKSPLRQVRVFREPGGATSTSTSMTMRSSSKQSMSSGQGAGCSEQVSESERLVERKLRTLETVLVDGGQMRADEVVASRSKATNSAQISSHLTFVFPSTPNDGQSSPVKTTTQFVSSTSSKSSSSKKQVITHRVVSPTGQSTMSTAPVTTDRDPWLQCQNQSQSQTALGGASAATGLYDLNDDFDSQLGSGAELESQSSSSLLDQLRARGYRSMINQRLVNTQQQQQQPQQQQPQQQPQQQQQQQQQTTQIGDSNIVTTSSTSITMSSSGVGSGPGTNQDEDRQKDSTSLQKTVPEQVAAHSTTTNNEATRSMNMSPLTNTTTTTTTTSNSSPIEPTVAHGVDASNGQSLLVQGANHASSEMKSQQSSEAANLSVQVDQLDRKSPVSETEDEDVRQAKANIRSHLERMRETEKFLKLVHEEEDKFQKQRQDLVLFNNLLLSTKLSAINGLTGGNKSCQPFDTDYGYYGASIGGANAPITTVGSRFGQRVCPGSAPITCCTGGNSNGFKLDSLQSNVSHAYPLNQDSLHFVQPSLTMHSPQHHTIQSSLFSADLYKPTVTSRTNSDSADPLLEPVKSIQSTRYSNSPTKTYRNWRRSKSQLGDQFNHSDDYATSSPPTLASSSMRSSQQNLVGESRRPLSANIGSIAAGSRPYMPSRQRRSMSQMRHSTIVPPQLGLYHGRDDDDDEHLMSEYKSSFGPPLLATPANSSAAPRPSRSPMRRATSHLFPTAHRTTGQRYDSLLMGDVRGDAGHNNDSDDGHDDSDTDEMSAYRASNYVPRVVPEGGPTYGRGRSLNRRQSALNLGSSSYETKTGSGNARSFKLDQPEADYRRRSVQTMYSSLTQLHGADNSDGCAQSREGSVSPIPGKRRNSDSEPTKLDRATRSQIGQRVKLDNSRLSELEQRIQANKKRREELLSEIKSGASLAEHESSQTSDDGPSSA